MVNPTSGSSSPSPTQTDAAATKLAAKGALAGRRVEQGQHATLRDLKPESTQAKAASLEERKIDAWPANVDNFNPDTAEFDLGFNFDNDELPHTAEEPEGEDSKPSAKEPILSATDQTHSRKRLLSPEEMAIQTSSKQSRLSAQAHETSSASSLAEAVESDVNPTYSDDQLQDEDSKPTGIRRANANEKPVNYDKLNSTQQAYARRNSRNAVERAQNAWDHDKRSESIKGLRPTIPEWAAKIDPRSVVMDKPLGFDQMSSDKQRDTRRRARIKIEKAQIAWNQDKRPESKKGSMPTIPEWALTKVVTRKNATDKPAGYDQMTTKKQSGFRASMRRKIEKGQAAWEKDARPASEKGQKPTLPEWAAPRARGGSKPRKG